MESQWQESAVPGGAWNATLASRCPSRSWLQFPVDVGHEVHELRVGLRAGAGALEHDRAERAGGDDGVRAGGLQLLEPHVADARALFLFLVVEQQAAARAAAVRILAVALDLADVGAEALEQRARLVHLAGSASQIAEVVERDLV